MAGTEIESGATGLKTKVVNIPPVCLENFHMKTALSRLILFVTLTTILAGCAAAPVAKRRVFWPDYPDTPKIEWIATYAGSADLLDRDSLFIKLVGTDDEVRVSQPISIASNGAGKVYVSNAGTSNVSVFDFNARKVSTLGSGIIQHVTGVSVDAQGNAYIADSASKKIHVYDRDDKPIAALDFSERMKSIGMFAVDKRSARLIIPDPKDHRIVVADLKGNFLFAFGKLGGGDGEFNLPLSVAVESDGGIVVCDSFNGRVQRFNAQGVFVSKFGRRGDGIGDFELIKGVAVDSEGHIYVTDGRGNRVTIFSPLGETLMAFGGKFAHNDDKVVSAGGFLMPQGIYIDQNDRIFIADQLNNRFQVFQYLNPRYLTEYPLVAPAAGAVK